MLADTHQHTHTRAGRAQPPRPTPILVPCSKTDAMGKANSKLTQEELAELQRNTKFDRRELQQWYKGFLKGT
jgi:hypothetical protein